LYLKKHIVRVEVTRLLKGRQVNKRIEISMGYNEIDVDKNGLSITANFKHS